MYIDLPDKFNLVQYKESKGLAFDWNAFLFSTILVSKTLTSAQRATLVTQFDVSMAP